MEQEASLQQTMSVHVIRNSPSEPGELACGCISEDNDYPSPTFP